MEDLSKVQILERPVEVADKTEAEAGTACTTDSNMNPIIFVKDTTEVKMGGGAVPKGCIRSIKVHSLRIDAPSFEPRQVPFIPSEIIEEEGFQQTEEGFHRYPSDGFQNKRRQGNPPRSKFNKRQRHDNKIQPSNGHLMFEEREFPLLEYPDYIKAKMDIEAHFNKKFSFNKPLQGENGAWTLPPADTMFTKPIWHDEELQASKATLNVIKKQLTDKDVGMWHTHTKNTNPAEEIAFAARRRANPEMVTQAWLKLYEILSTYPLVPPEEQVDVNEGSEENEEIAKPFNSVHLCEAPGAFIVALNHYLAVNRPSIKWQWLGSTLNPYYEGTPSDVCVVDDRLIFHTIVNRAFGKNNTGNLMEKENLNDIIKRAEKIGPIHLCTADGSIDCQTDPANQEITTHNLHYCELVASLSLLAPGGSLVIKKFTMFESRTINLMYILCCTFKEVHIVKPGTSKEGNSEVYVTCLNYCGKEKIETHIKMLMEFYGINNDLAMFSFEDLPKDFLLQLRKCTEVFKAYQVNTITKNLLLFEKMSEKDQQYIDLLKFKANAFYFERSHCTRIAKERTLTAGKVNKSRYLLESDLNKPITSTLIRTKCPHKKLALLKKYTNEYIEEFSKRKWIIDITKGDFCSVSRLPTMELDKIPLDKIKGRPYKFIKSTKFCSPKIQEAFRESWNLWESMDDHSVLDIDDSLLKYVRIEYPEAEVLKSAVTAGPLGELGALKEALLRFKEGKISSESSLVLLNVTLFSRLQCGLLLLLGSAFNHIAFYTGKNLGTQAPVIILDKLKSVQHCEDVLKALHDIGWHSLEGCCNAFEFLQLVSFPSLVENIKLCSIFYYNLHHCIHRSLMLQKALDKKLGADSEPPN